MYTDIQELINNLKRDAKEKKLQLQKEWKEKNTKEHKAAELEESFRRERNTRWAKHKGIDDVMKWYADGNRMPNELELETIVLKNKNYLLSEIFEMFDKQELEAKKRKETPVEKQPDDWFKQTMEPGNRFSRADSWKRVIKDGIETSKKDFFRFLDTKCGKTYESCGCVCYRGWQFKQPVSDDSF
jgi:hypothetical protein